MAIQKSYTDIYGATHAEAYTRIQSVYTNDEMATIEIHIWHNAAARSKADASARKHYPALGEATISGLMVTADYKTGLAKKVEPIILGKHLENKV